MKSFERVPDVYNYYGELLLDQGKYEEAIEKFDMAVEMEKQERPMCMNVLPLINKALALFQWKQQFGDSEELCKKALISEFTLGGIDMVGMGANAGGQLIRTVILRSRQWRSFSSSKEG